MPEHVLLSEIAITTMAAAIFMIASHRKHLL